MVNTTKKTTSKTAASPAAPATPAKTAAPKKAVAKKAETEASKVEAKATSENIIVESKIDTIADDSLGINSVNLWVNFKVCPLYCQLLRMISVY